MNDFDIHPEANTEAIDKQQRMGDARHIWKVNSLEQNNPLIDVNKRAKIPLHDKMCKPRMNSWTNFLTFHTSTNCMIPRTNMQTRLLPFQNTNMTKLVLTKTTQSVNKTKRLSNSLFYHSPEAKAMARPNQVLNEFECHVNLFILITTFLWLNLDMQNSSLVALISTKRPQAMRRIAIIVPSMLRWTQLKQSSKQANLSTDDVTTNTWECEYQSDWTQPDATSIQYHKTDKLYMAVFMGMIRY